MGMILDLFDNLVECKYLDCPAFPIDFQGTSNYVPVADEPSAAVQIAESAKISQGAGLQLRWSYWETSCALWYKVSGMHRLEQEYGPPLGATCISP